jgi:ABC-type sugar transport system permease subunit
VARPVNVAQGATSGSARAPLWERNIQYLLPLPVVLLLALFIIYPTITAIQFSLNHVTITGEGLQMRFTGLDNYARAFRDPLIATAARQTLEWVVVVTLVEMLLGLGLALLVSSGIRLRGVVISVLMNPFVLPPVAVSLAWRFSYQEQFGVDWWPCWVSAARPAWRPGWPGMWRPASRAFPGAACATHRL